MPIKKIPKQSTTVTRSVSAPTKIVPVSLELPPAHAKQYEFINAFESHNARFIVAACGSKYGKTFGASLRIVREAWQNKHSLNFWVAPTYSHSEMAYDTIKRMLPKDSFIEYKADLKLVIVTPGGNEHSRIEFKSGDKEASLRGFAVDFFILDEAARIKKESWEALQTTLSQTFGRGIIVSTPKGRGWFYDLYRRGEKFDEQGRPRFGPLNPDPFPDWYSIRMPTWENPTVPPQSIRDFKRNNPDDVFKQEICAEFLDESAGVFRGVTECIKGTTFTAPQPGRFYVMGVDLARLRDYSVMTVIDPLTRHVVYMERFNQIAWEAQYHKFRQIALRYNNALTCMDSTGLGDPIVSTLVNTGMRIEPYQITGTAAKQQLIDKLRLNIEQQLISYPHNVHTQQMIEELKAYECEFTDSGKVKFSAPGGKFDDCVISLSLANWIIDRRPMIYRTYFVRGV